MKTESRIGPMACVRVKGVHKKIQPSLIIYEIIGEDWKLGCTNLHAFLTIRNGEEMHLPPHMLQENDLIWIDGHTFTMDGSLTKR